ncbi:MAG TPA: hypothetical protein VGX76_12380, partial [Pirellulales bacterium]|nr:hypothetical protein [Pirellulales bacterium]
MFTSNYARAKRLPPDLKPISISIKPPRWWKGAHYPPLCPSRAMLKMPRAEYDANFAAILASLDAQRTFEELGDNAVLLCYEPPNTWCHRRLIADWIETALGIFVPEF